MKLMTTLRDSDDEFFKEEGTCSSIDESLLVASGEIMVDDIGNIVDAKIGFSNRSTQIDSILNSLKSGYYYIPPFQRRYVWDKEKVACLAVSVIKNFPIPPMYVYVDKKGRNHVVLDGQQRMISLFLYFNDLTYTSSDNNIDFKAVSELNESMRSLEREIENKRRDGSKAKELVELEGKLKKASEKMFVEYGMKRCQYFIDVDSSNGKEQMNVSFSHFSDTDKEFLLHKCMDMTVVECNDSHPETTYAHIFKLLNSAGKNLGPQEIRNGVFWKTDLYKNLYRINVENSAWRTIYGNVSIYSKDLEILLKVLALSHYAVIDKEDKVCIGCRSFSWAGIMDQYSLFAVDNDVTKDIINLEKFLKNLENVDPTLKCKKAVFEAVYAAVGLIYPGFDVKIDYKWLCEEAGKDFGTIESSRKSVEERLNIAYITVKEKYGA